MLVELRVKNFATVEDVTLKLRNGLSCFTGETGAGKSLLLNAITLLLGAKAKSDVVRTDCPFAELEGIFEIAGNDEKQKLAEELGFESSSEDGHILIVRRQISASKLSKNRIWIQGKSATRLQLQQLLGDWIEVSGQHEFMKLLNADYLLKVLDHFGGLNQQRTEVSDCFRNFKEKEAVILDLESKLGDKNSLLEFKSFQLQELEKAGIHESFEEEESQLLARSKEYKNISKIQHSLQTLENILEGGTNSQQESWTNQCHKISHTLKELSELSGESQRASELSGELDRLTSEIQSLIYETQNSLSIGDENWEDLQDRISSIQRLKRKFQLDSAGLFALKTQLIQEVDDLEGIEEKLNLAQKDCELSKQKLLSKSKELSQKRQHAAKTLSKKWMQSLVELGMKDAQIELNLESSEEQIRKEGIDQASIAFTANRGEKLRAVSKVASGGELSRIMLALKSSLKISQEIGVYLFDEVDSGIGGLTAKVVARKLRKISEQTQVLVVTHLAQVAADSHHHFAIKKKVDAKRSRSIVESLTQEDRIEEIARMMGQSGNEKANQLAREMLHHAQI